MKQSKSALSGMKQFLELLPDTVLIVNKEGIIEDLLNYQPEISLSLTPQQQQGQTIQELFRYKNLKGNSGNELLSAFLDTMKTRKPNTIHYEVENDGHTGYAEGYITPFEDRTFGIFRNMTKRIEAQQEIINEKNKLTMALKAGNLSVWSYIPNSDSFDLADDHTVPQPGMKLWDVTKQLIPEDRERHVKLVTDIVNEKHEQSIEQFRLLTPEGKIRWYEIYSMGVRGEDGKISSLIGTQKDITDQKNKIQELIENRQQRDLLLQITNMIIWEYDYKTDICTSGRESLFFDSNTTLKDIYKTVAPEHQEMYLKAYDEILNKRSDLMNIQFRVKGLDGLYRWVRLIAKVSKYDKEGNVHKLIGTREDITEEVEREQRFRNYIQRSELAIQAANIIQWDLDIKTQEYTRLYPDPINPGNFIRKSFIFTVHPDDRLILQREQEKRARECKGYSNLHLRVMLDGDTEYRWMNTFSVPLDYNPDGSLKNVTGLLIDITHIEKVEEGNRMKMTFLANMSHEIRTPLNAIVGFSQLLAQTDDHEDKEEFIRIIEENNDLLLQIINDILDISKIDAGKMTFNYSDFDITEVITDLKQVYDSHLSSEVKLICKLPYKKYMIHSEKNRLIQVITNLLNNAAKFTLEGSITIGYEVIPNGLSFYVSDTGKGIDKENLKHVFERFAKFDKFVPGTGLGLSICQMIVNKLGGEMSVESELGKGSTFRFTIACEAKSDLLKTPGFEKV
nr:PAS domain-containing sensor histidine kinase [Parabacteroides goldsteinii]